MSFAKHDLELLSRITKRNDHLMELRLNDESKILLQYENAAHSWKIDKVGSDGFFYMNFYDNIQSILLQLAPEVESVTLRRKP